MDSSELLALADRNLAEFCREQARWLPPFNVEERPYGVFVASGTRFPAGPSNCVFPFGESVSATLVLDEARSYFSSLGRGFSVYTPTHSAPELARACEALQWPKLSDAPGMVLTERLQPPEVPNGAQLCVVQSEQEATDFATVAAEAYETLGLPNAVARKLLSQPTRWMQPQIHTEVAYEDDRPVACAMLLFSHGIAGVYWVGTLPHSRGRGHATRLIRSVSNRAFDAGARCVVLQATPFGEPVYRKLGYREFTRYPWYLAMQ